MKTHRILIPALVFAVFILGGVFTSTGLSEWYPALVKPEFTPPNWVFTPAWIMIYIMAATSAILFWDRYETFKMRYYWINGLFRFNLLLNLFWSYIFFSERELTVAFIEITVLNLTTLALIILLWRISRISSLLLVPYLLWGSFAAYLNYVILTLNP
jgi:tryptophan-rich sensory protein